MKEKRIALLLLVAGLAAMLVLPLAHPIRQVQAVDKNKLYLGDLTAAQNSCYFYKVDTTEWDTKIKVGNIEYDKGVCTHPGPDGPAELIYNIEGLAYTVFYAVGGKDASAGAQVGGDSGIKGTKVQLQVYVDGVLKADSGELAYPDVYEFKVDITGAKELKLMVADGGDGIYCDATSWAAAQFLTSSADVPSMTTPDPTPEPTPIPTQDPAFQDAVTVYISDMVFQNETAYADALVRDANIADELIYINDKYFEKGVCIHAMPSGEAYFDIDLTGLGFTTFASYIGITESMADNVTMGSVVFRIYGDGELKYESNLISYPSGDEVNDPELVKVDITGVNMLRLALTNGGDGHAGDWGGWGNACVSKLTETEDIFATPVPTATPEPKETPVKPANSPTPTAPEKRTEEHSSGWILPVCIIAAAAGAAAAGAILFLKKKNSKERRDKK